MDEKNMEVYFGTTAAVTHKMGRRWIMVGFGEHCHTHIIPRLKKIIDGEDPGDITEVAGWKGGGGFPNLTIKKIPNTVLAKCEWGHDDYSLQIENLPIAEKPQKKQPLLFDGEAE
ncbi:MAG: hypothetical protein LBL79_09885 [Prevotella sp.]|jgi:hypothetical protein|nr:hypothetical protein [Prevotella sp.]